jgi:hypothetical protein
MWIWRLDLIKKGDSKKVETYKSVSFTTRAAAKNPCWRIPMSSNEDLPKDVSDSDGWRAHELSQLGRFRALSLRQKLEAVESMADVVRCLDQMRREGKFGSGSHSPKSEEMTNRGRS